jgi:hypothetical protein
MVGAWRSPRLSDRECQTVCTVIGLFVTRFERSGYIQCRRSVKKGWRWWYLPGYEFIGIPYSFARRPGWPAMVQSLLLCKNLNLTSWEGPRQREEILELSWNWQAT